MSDARVFEVTVRVLNHSVAETPPSPGSPEYQRFSRRLLREVKLSAHAGLSSHEPAGPRSAGSGTHPRGHTAEPTAHGHRSTLFPFTGGLQTRGQTVSDPGGRPHRMAWLGSLSPSAGGTGDLSFRSGAASAGKRSPVTAASAPLCGQRRTLARSWGEPHWWQTDELEEKQFAPPSRTVEGLRFYPSRELIVSPTGPEMKGTVLPTARQAASASRWGQFPFWPPRPHGGAGGRGPRSGSACWGRNPKAWET